MDKELRDRLYWLEEELLSEEPTEVTPLDLDSILEGIDLRDYGAEEEPEAPVQPHRGKQKLSRAEKLERQIYEETYPMEERSLSPQKKKGTRGLKILAILEIIAIFCVLGWWMQWLI